MTRAGAMAFAAAAAGVYGGWDLLAGVERARVLGWIAAAVRPLHRARREGRLPTTAERRRLALMACGALFAGGWLVAGAAAGLLAAAAGPAATGALVVARRRAFQGRLASAAPQAARALAAELAAGRSVRGALAEAAVGLDGPAGHELRRAGSALRAGHSSERVLEELRARAGSRAWDTLVAAILVQRDAGGDLPGLLRELAAAQEAAARADHDARAATAQARFTARLVTGLPAGALALAELAAPGFVAGLLANALSVVLLTLALGLQAAAYASVRAITRGLAAP